MKKLVNVVALILAVIIGRAQAFDGNINYNKLTVAGLACEFNYEKKLVEKTCLEKMQATMGKSKSIKDFEVFRGVRMPEWGPDVYDIYVKIDKKSKKEDNKSVLYMMVSLGNENFVTPTSHPTVIAGAKNYINNMMPWFAAKDLENQIKEQEEAVKKTEKQYNRSIEDGDDLAKKKVKIEKEIEENKSEQARKKDEVDKQRQILEALKAKKI
jgi:hypothetical protein